MEAFVEDWRGLAGMAALVVVSFVVAQLLVLCSQRLRLRRVLEKSRELTDSSAVAPDYDVCMCIQRRWCSSRARGPCC